MYIVIIVVWLPCPAVVWSPSPDPTAHGATSSLAPHHDDIGVVLVQESACLHSGQHEPVERWWGPESETRCAAADLFVDPLLVAVSNQLSQFGDKVGAGGAREEMFCQIRLGQDPLDHLLGNHNVSQVVNGEQREFGPKPVR